MHARYGRQFVKMLRYIHTYYVEPLQRELAGDEESDLGAVLTRLSVYLHQQQYLQSPEGRVMPLTDESAVTHA